MQYCISGSEHRMDKKVRKKKVPLLHICYFKWDDRHIKKKRKNSTKDRENMKLERCKENYLSSDE